MAGTAVGGYAAVRRGSPALALGVLCTLLFLTFLDNTIVSVGLGSVQTDLHAGVTELQWVVGAYALTFASTMLACGMIADEFGRKVVMLSGAGVFCAGSVLCALAPNAPALIAGRAVMGLGAAASEPGTLSMLRHIYTDERIRTRAIGVWSGVSALALALGPAIGGMLVGVWNWRGIFWFNLAFGLAALAMAAVVLPENADPQAQRVDTAGTLLGAGSLAALVFAIISSESTGFASPQIIALLCVSAVGAVAFVWQERRAPHPLLDLRYLRLPTFTVPIIVAFCSYFATFAIFFFTALYLNEVVGYSGFQIALAFLPMTVLMIIASVLAGRWTSTAGLRASIVAGCLIFGAGLLLTSATISPHPRYLPLAAALALAGIGVGATVVPITSSVLSVVPPEHSGMAASATNTSRQIGAVTGVAILGALVNAQLRADLTGRLHQLGIPPSFQTIVINALETGTVPSSSKKAPRPGKLVQEVIQAAYHAFLTGLHAALYLSAGLVIAASLLTLATLPRRTRAPGRPGTAAFRPGPEPGPGRPDGGQPRPAGPRRLRSGRPAGATENPRSP